MPYGTVNADLMTTSDGVSSAGVYGLKNRLINGDMRIDQRNAGASVTPINSQYLVDRWFAVLSQTSKFSVQQNAASVTPPVGFTNYLGCTSLSAYTVGASEFFAVRQSIEGLNVADLGWGTANAQPITISFWVRSSLTGAFGGSLINSNGSRAYPFTFTINSANTWEKETITIAGDTSGTWLATNSIGITLTFGLGYGSSLSGTAGAWNAGTAFMPTGATSVVGTNGATFYITGVQLEKGSTATSFDVLDYGRSLIQCQRYYYRIVSTSLFGQFGFTTSRGTANSEGVFALPVTMRASPTTLDFSTLLTSVCAGGSNSAVTAAVINSGSNNPYVGNVSFTTSGSLGSAGQVLQVLANNSVSAFLGFGAEL